MAGNRPHYRLEAWKMAMALMSMVYRTTQSFPKEENYGLTSQLRRSAISIPSNIAEGASRYGTKEFAQFLNVSIGSISELETQFLIAVDLGYLEANDPVFEQLEQVSRLVTGLHKSVRG
jgi:four helix bundle protein